MENKQVELGDVNVKKLIITSNGNKLDLIPQTIMLSVYEDIMSPCLTMEIHVNDAVGALRTLPILGGEIIDLEFESPGRTAYKAQFKVYEIDSGTGNDNQTALGYTIKAVSEEAFRDAVNNVEKGYKDNIHNMVMDIVRNIMHSKKKIVYEETKGIQHIVFTRKNVFEGIEILRKRAVSQKYLSSTFYFFENKYGFNFNTLEGLMDQNKTKIGDKIFTRHQAINEHQSPEGFRQILSYNVGRQFNSISSLHLGALKGYHETFDILKKDFKKKKYTINDFPQFKDAEKSGTVTPFTPKLMEEYGGDTANFYYNISNSGVPDTYLNDTLMKKIAWTSIQLNGSIDLYCYGDSSMTIGDVITLKMPKTDGKTKQNVSEEPLQNGNYVVTGMHHNIQFSSRNPKHTMVFTCNRGTYKQ